MLISDGFDATIAGVFGLLIGSFLNVVIYRLPKIMERQWAVECAELSGKELPEAETFNLMVPRSRCQKLRVSGPAPQRSLPRCRLLRPAPKVR